MTTICSRVRTISCLTCPYPARWRECDGHVVSEAEWNSRVSDWLPSDDDRAFVASLMQRVVEPGKYAGWIAPPQVPVNDQPMNFEYVRFKLILQ